MASKTNPTTTTDTLNALIDGFTNHVPSGTTAVTLDGQVVPIPTLVTQLKTYAQTYQAVDDASAARTKALQARRGIEASVETTIAEVRDAVRTMLGKSSPDLSKFGIKPIKARAKLSAEELVVRKDKANATREARGTKGSKQKSEITGQTAQTGAAGANGTNGAATNAPTASPPQASK
jgi:hypothetical protein